MKLKNAIGERYGRLVIKSRATSDSAKRSRWLCQCDCGNVIITAGERLLKGKTRSCGCLRDELNTKHGESHRTREYGIWAAMRNRCNNPNDKRYASYGGRGIRVCPRWAEYKIFLTDMGRRPSARHTLERNNNAAIMSRQIASGLPTPSNNPTRQEMYLSSIKANGKPYHNGQLSAASLEVQSGTD